MKKIFDRVVELKPKSVGVEIETQRQIAENLKGGSDSSNTPISYRGIDSFSMCSFDSHTESSTILEINTVPAHLSNPQNVMLIGELVRIFNPFQFKGQSDNCSGSCHCHVNIGGNDGENGARKKSLIYWSKPVQAAMLPFMTIGYMKHGKRYDFRAKRQYLTDNTVTNYSRGTGMMLNFGVSYAEYGLEYRANENSPLWVYLLAPVIALIESQPELAKALTDDLGIPPEKVCDRHHASSNRHVWMENAKYMEEALDIIRPVLLDNIELITSQVSGKDNKEFLKLVITAYLNEDFEFYDEILRNLLSKNIRTKVMIDYIKSNFVHSFNKSMLSGEYESERDREFLNSIYKEIKF